MNFSTPNLESNLREMTLRCTLSNEDSIRNFLTDTGSEISIVKQLFLPTGTTIRYEFTQTKLEETRQSR